MILVMIGVRYLFCLLQGAKHLLCSTSLASRRKRIHQHFDDLERCYFSIRQGDLPSKCVEVLNFKADLSMMLLRVQTCIVPFSDKLTLIALISKCQFS